MITNHLKIAICADSTDPNATVADRFARCEFFGVYNHNTLSFEFLNNEAKQEMSGAGGKASKQIAELGVSAVLVPEVGPKAFDALEAFGIEIFRYQKHFTVRDAIYAYYEKKLPQVLVSTKKGKH